MEKDLEALREALDQQLPPRVIDQNLLIGTWNIRAFGGYTDAWKAGEDDSPKRDLQSLLAISEILRRFDVVAVQEVRGDVSALRATLDLLGPNWDHVLTDVTRGDRGNGERLAFIFDRRTVRMSGLAGELVVPEEEKSSIAGDALSRQFARTPFAVSFKSGGETFVLVTLHVLYGESPEDRAPELRAIAEWLARWARDEDVWDHDLVALGDFNIDRKGSPLYRAFTSTGLTVPDRLHEVPRTIFGEEENPASEKFYDQIAWFTGEEGKPALSMDFGQSGHFDFLGKVLPSRDLSRRSLSWRISDHFPLWAEFRR